MHEEPFRVVLDVGRARDADKPYEFQWTAEAYVRHFEGGAQRAGRLVWANDVQEDLLGLGRTPPDPAAQARLGDALLALLRPMGWDRDEAEILAAARAGRPVRILLRFAAAELYGLPWELLPLGDDGRTLGSLAELRYQWPTRAERAPLASPPEGGRLLFAWAGRVPHTQHRLAIRGSFEGSAFPFDEVNDVLSEASYTQLAERLRTAAREGRPYHALHLLAHGAPVGSAGVGLALEGGTVDGVTLGRLVAEHASTLRLVVLCACRSADPGRIDSHLGSLAQRLHSAGVADVLASRLPLSTEGSILLAQTIYPALLAEDPPVGLEIALARARDALLRSEHPADALSLQRYVANADTRDTRPFVFRPYRGMYAFQPEHRRFFFGRDAEIAEAIRDLRALKRAGRPRLLVVVGASGTGKSSVVLGGVVPRLMHARWSWRRMVPGRAPLAALDEALRQRPAKGAPWLLVVDQLEELFSQVAEDPTGRAERDAFTRQLWSLASEPGVHVIATLRADQMGRCGEVHLDDATRVDALFTKEYERHALFVAQMKEAQLRAAIVAPARAVGLTLPDALATQMLTDVGAEPGALPLLEYTLDLLWQRREDDSLRPETYLALGGVRGALNGRADQIWEGLDAPGRRAVRWLMVRLVLHRGDGLPDTRRRVRLGEPRPPAAVADALDAALAKLVDERLLVQDMSQGQPTVEVAHEALIRSWAKLKDWVGEAQRMLAEVDRVEGWAKEWSVFSNALLSDAQLVYAQELRTRHPDELSPKALDLIAASEAAVERARQKEAQHKRELEQRTAEAERQARRARDQARMVAVREAAGDPTLQAVLLREVEKPEETRGWEQTAYDVLMQPLSVALLRDRSERLHWADVRLRGPEERDRWAKQFLNRSDERVWYAAFSADGSHVLTSAVAAPARVWRADGLGDPVVVGNPSGSLSSVFAPDGERCLTLDDDTPSVWRADGEGAPVILQGPVRQGQLFGFSPTGDRVATASSLDNAVRVWRADGGGEPVVLRGHEAPVQSVAFSPDGRWVVTASDDKTARVWRADGVGEALVLRGHEGRLKAASFSPDGLRVVTASSDGTARVWRVSGEEGPATSYARSLVGRLLHAIVPGDHDGEVVVLRGHEGVVEAASFSPDGRQILTASGDGTARVWQADGAGEPVVLKGHESGINSAVFSRGGHRVLTASTDHTARVWRADGRGDPLVLRGHTGSIQAAAFSPDGGRAVTASFDGTARVWWVEQRSGVAVFRIANTLMGGIISAAISPDGARVALAPHNNPPQLWSADGTGEATLLTGHAAQVGIVAFSPDGQRLVTASADGAVRVWRLDVTGDSVLLSGHEALVASATFSSSNDHIVTASHDQTVRVWRADGEGQPVVLRGPDCWALSAVFSPDGTRVLTTWDDHTARIWRADGAGEPVVLRGHEGTVFSAAFSPDGQRVVTASGDTTARVWRSDGTGDAVILRGHQEWVTSARFSSDGLRVLTASWDGTARVWRSDGVGQPVVLRGHDGSVRSAHFSPDESQVVTASEDRTARVWRSDGTGDALILQGHTLGLLNAQFSANGRSVLTYAFDGTARLWPLFTVAEQLDRLWRATSYSLPPEERARRLGESDEEAAQRFAAGQARITALAAEGAYAHSPRR